VRKIAFPAVWDKLLLDALNRRKLLEVYFELTYKCNLACQYCYIPKNYSPQEELTTPQIFTILAELKKIGTLQIYFTGGEVFLKKDSREILSYARKQGFIVTVITNGTLIDRETAKLLKRLSIRLEISLKGTSPETYKKITGSKEAFQNTMESIQRLKEEKVPFTLSFLVNKENFKEFSKAKELAQNLKARFIFSYLIEPGWENSVPIEKFQISASQIKEIHRVYFQGKEYPDTCLSTTSVNTDLFYCRAGKSMAAISPYGELKACIDLHYPKFELKTLSVKEAWEKLVETIEAISPGKDYLCPECEWKSFCFRCPAKSWHYNQKFDSCPPWCKKLAKELASYCKNLKDG